MDRPSFAASDLPLPLAGARNATLVTAALLAALILPWAGTNAGLTVQPALDWLDPDGAFVFITVHHIVQGGLAFALIALAAMAARSRGWSWREFGFARGDVRLALEVVGAFTLVYAVLTFGWDFAPYALAHSQPGLPYFFTPTNVVGVLAFEWILVGVSEEILFRGLILGLLTRISARSVRLGARRAAFRVSVAGLATAVIFAFAHTILYERAFFLPFSVVPNWSQVVLAFFLGVYYAALRERTGSLLGSILSHNISDGLYMSMVFLAVAITR